MSSGADWDRYAATYQAAWEQPITEVHYGPDLPTERELRLLGDLRGKRVLELGCGGGQCSVALAKQGATTIGVDFSAEQLAFARRLCEREEVRVEFRHGDIADLAFLRADSIDLVFSAFVFGYVEDLNRVFRQVHRVLKVGAPLVFSLQHPYYDLVEDGADGRVGVSRSYWDQTPIAHPHGGVSFSTYHRSVGELYSALHRASYRVDLIAEPEPAGDGPRSSYWRDSYRTVPPTLIIRARKEGN